MFKYVRGNPKKSVEIENMGSKSKLMLLKNSYEGIEEVHITNPSYASIRLMLGAKVKYFL